MEPPAGAEEQSRPNSAADRDHLQLPGLQVLVITLVFVPQIRIGFKGLQIMLAVRQMRRMHVREVNSMGVVIIGQL
jgi:hypothetical protein